MRQGRLQWKRAALADPCATPQVAQGKPISTGGTASWSGRLRAIFFLACSSLSTRPFTRSWSNAATMKFSSCSFLG